MDSESDFRRGPQEDFQGGKDASSDGGGDLSSHPIGHELDARPNTFADAIGEEVLTDGKRSISVASVIDFFQAMKKRKLEGAFEVLASLEISSATVSPGPCFQHQASELGDNGGSAGK